MNLILLHIPHSSEKIPKFFWKQVCTNKSIVKHFIKDITDTKTDKLFGSNNHKKIKFKYCRVFCDVEKYLDDSKEIMSQFGMGAIYSKTNHGTTFLNVDNLYKQKVISKYYLPYHKRLDKIARSLLKKNEKVILIDCHSFSKDAIMFVDKKANLPDICIGYNDDYNKKLAGKIVDYFSSLNYLVKENYPYEGAIVPNFLIEKPNKNFYSVMIEINKDIYLSQSTFTKLKKEINNLLSLLENLKID